MTKTFAISNGTKVAIDYNGIANVYVLHHYVGSAIYGMGLCKTMEEAEARTHNLAKQWGGFTATEI